MNNIENLTANEDLAQKLAQVREIQAATVLALRGAASPRTGVALMGATLTCSVVSAGSFAFGLVDKLGTTPFMVALVGAVFSYALIQWVSSAPKSWTDKIDRVLTEYEPLDRFAYHQLQQCTRKAGDLDFRCVIEWLGLEREAINAAMGIKPQKLSFLERKL